MVMKLWPNIYKATKNEDTKVTREREPRYWPLLAPAISCNLAPWNYITFFRSSLGKINYETLYGKLRTQFLLKNPTKSFFSQILTSPLKPSVHATESKTPARSPG